jgi:4'-phosphopantetheinyl transferase
VNRNFVIPELNITWSLAPYDPRLDDSAVQVWAASLAVPSEMIAAWTVVLSSDERLRAGRFRSATDRDRFIAAHGILHSILASYLNTDPAKVGFQFGPRGKPLLEGPPYWLHFNLAHSGDLALVAVSRCCPVGVDVELIRPMNDAQDIAARFFSRREARELEGLPLNQQGEGFFNLWTRKEACLKATGEGLSERLSSVEVTFIPGRPARLVQFPGESDACPPWTLAELRPATMYVGALAAPTAGLRLSCWRWPAS